MCSPAVLFLESSRSAARIQIMSACVIDSTFLTILALHDTRNKLYSSALKNVAISINGVSTPYAARYADVIELRLIHSIGAPGLIIDSCAAVGVAVTIPQFMQNMFRIHGRQFESVTLGSTLGSAVGATVVPASVTLTAIRSSVSSSITHTLLNTESSSTGGSSTTASNTARPVTPSTPSSTTTSNTAGPTIISTSSSGPSPGSSSLSSGAKIGIGVTVPIVLILLIVGIFIFFRRRKRSVSAENGQENDDGGLPEAVATITELKDNSYPPNYPTNRAEAGGNQIHEMNDNDSHKYSQGMRVPPIHELNSDTDNSRNDLTSADTSHIEGIKSPQSNAAAMGKKSVFTPPPKPTFPAPWENSPEMVYPAPNLGPGPGPQDGDEDLKKMQEEMAVIRERKERLRSLQALEEREEELKRRIQEREKTGGPAS